jgi:drug/metabolite transporter (DMT)-like permease
MDQKNSPISGYLSAAIGVLIFSLSLPMTKVAISEVSPYFAFLFRTALAGTLALPFLTQILLRRPDLRSNPILKKLAWPTFWQIAGVVIGFPLLTSLAIQKTSPSHGALVIAVVPILTAALSSLIFSRPRSKIFWILAALATLTSLLTLLWINHLSFQVEDLLFLAAAVLVAIGYVAGTKTSAILGGTGAIALALVISLPAALMGSWWTWLPAQLWIGGALVALLVTLGKFTR